MSFLATGDSHQANLPDFYRAQGLRPDLIAAESGLFGLAMADGALSRKQKEYIAVAVSGENLSTYCATTHSAALRTLGVTDSDLDQLGVDHHYADIPDADKAMLDFALKLTRTPGKVAEPDIAALRAHGFSDQQILEGVVVASLMNFANRMSLALGAVPDHT